MGDPGRGVVWVENLGEFWIEFGSWGMGEDAYLVTSLPDGVAGGYPVAVDGRGMALDYATVDASLPPGEFVVLETRALQAGYGIVNPPVLYETDPPMALGEDVYRTADGTWLARSARLVYREPLFYGHQYGAYVRVLSRVGLEAPLPLAPTFSLQVFATNNHSYQDWLVNISADYPNQRATCPLDYRPSPVLAELPLATVRGATVPIMDTWGILILVAGLVGIAHYMRGRRLGVD